MRMLIAGGGTGGHLFPGVALAQRLLEDEWQAQVLFVGTAKGIEARVLPELKLPLQTIEISGLVGTGFLHQLRMAPQLWRSLRQSLKILDRFAPDVVVGVGGYASGPVLLAARIKGIPIVVHEQNAAFGLTNSLMARWADRVCVSFPRIATEHSGPVVVTGNPVRSSMTTCPPYPQGEPTLLVFGGSRGARALNEAVVAALPELKSSLPGLKIIHQTGAEDVESVRSGYQTAGWDRCEIVPFIDNMAAALAAAHLVLCRAGATTIAELTVCGRPAIFVPYPHAAADHQTANARALCEQGAGFLLPQSELDGPRLGQLLGRLLNDQPTLLRMATVAKSLGQPDAVDKLLHQCRAVARGGEGYVRQDS